LAAAPVLVNLTIQQPAQINTYIANKQYADGYRYVKTIISANIQTNQNPTTLSNLRILSASINANDGSARIEFDCGNTIAYAVLTNLPATEAKFQQVSDSLAYSILNVIAAAEIPNAAAIITTDLNEDGILNQRATTSTNEFTAQSAALASNGQKQLATDMDLVAHCHAIKSIAFAQFPWGLEAYSTLKQEK